MTTQRRTTRAAVPAPDADPAPVPWTAGEWDVDGVRQSWQRDPDGAAGAAPAPLSARPAAGAVGGTERLRRAVKDALGDLVAAGGLIPAGAPARATVGALQRSRLSARLSGSLRLAGWRRFWWAYLLGLLALGFLAIQLGLGLSQAAADRLTTWQYGEIRTSHLLAYFGFKGESPAHPTLLTAVNDRGTVHIFILPAGQTAQAQVVEVPLGNDPTGRVPVELQAFDADLDGHPDLLVQPLDGGPPAVFLLDTGKGTFRLPTAEEQGRLVLPSTGAGH